MSSRDHSVSLTDHGADSVVDYLSQKPQPAPIGAGADAPAASEVKEKPGDAAAPIQEPFSVYTKNEKWILVALMSFGCLFSPLTANIYFPAIPTIAADFGKSTELINLTVTVYMVLQGVAPMFWGPLADTHGRRLIFLACLIILSLSCVGLALCPSSDYWLLMLLRCVQAAGSASTVAIGAGVIGDIATPAERGGFFGFVTVGALLGPAVGPVIGGGLTQGLGWRSIFWFMCIASGLCFVVLLLVMPETLRSRVGNGSIKPSPIHRPLLPVIGRNAPQASSSTRPPPKPYQNPFGLFLYLDVVTLLLFGGLMYSVLYAVLTPFSSSFAKVYPYLNETELGLCFLAMGGGMLFGTVVSGKTMNVQYQKTKEKLLARANADAEGGAASVTDDRFPYEWARLRSSPYYLSVFIVALVGYGWALESGVSIAVPLILQIIMGYTMSGFMTCVQCLLVDLLPTRGSSVTAANNIVRCGLGAAMSAVIDLIIDAVGYGWTYVIMAAICVVLAPLVWVEIKIGPVWRAQRRRKDEEHRRREAEKANK